ncbi:IucA/IucC family protein [Amycolatopsis samaneae]
MEKATATGRLDLRGPVMFGPAAGRRVVEDPVDLLNALVEQGLVGGTPEGWARLRSEIAESVTGHALSLAAADRLASELRDHSVFADEVEEHPFTSLVNAFRISGERGSLLVPFERMVVDGHPLHPAAKIRIGMTPDEVVRFSPEFGAAFDVALIAVSRVAATGASNFESAQSVLRRAFPRAIAAAELEMRAAGLDPARHVLVPVHPHQLRHAVPALHADALSDGTVVPLRTGLPARPLMSVRTLAVREPAASTGLHIKTALEVQLTNAVRGVSPAAVHNGPRMSALLTDIVAGDLDLALTTADGRPGFAVLRELGSVAYVPPEDRGPRSAREAANGTPARKRSLGAILREDSEDLLGEDELAMPIAALLAKSPLTGACLVHDLLSEISSVTGTPVADVAPRWLGAHVERCVPPALTLLVRYGIALEPHPQNTVLVLKDRWPHRVLVRDLGGARLFEPRLARRGFTAELRPGSALLAPDAASVRAKLYFPLFGNHLGELVAAIADATRCAQQRLWSVVRRCVQRTFLRLGRSACCHDEATDARTDAEELLTKPWRHKAMLTMRLNALVTDQRYVTGPNPLAASAPATVPAGLSEAEDEMLTGLRENQPDLVQPWLDELGEARLRTLNGAFSAILRERGLVLAARITESELLVGRPPAPSAVLTALGPGLPRTGTLACVTMPSGRTLSAVCRADTGFAANEVVSPIVVRDGDEVRRLQRPEELADLILDDTPSTGAAGWRGLRAELVDSARNLALARAAVQRRFLTHPEGAGTAPGGRAASDRTLDLDASCADGHTIHPCPRARHGFTPADSLAYCPESADTVGLVFVAVRKDSVVSTPDRSGASVGAVLADHYPAIAAHAVGALTARGHAPSDYELIPVHPWQARVMLPDEYREELAAGTIVALPEARLACRPTVSVRTLVTAAPGRHGRRLSVKVSLDVQLTSTRRTISPATTANGPRLSRLLRRLLAADPITCGKVDCVPDLAGIAFSPEAGTSSRARERGLSALLRADPADHARPGEVVLSACALFGLSAHPGGTVLAELIEERARRLAVPTRDAAFAFFGAYADLMLSAGLPLLWHYGIGLEAHMQNTMLVMRGETPVRVLLRDFGGIRVHTGRLRDAGLEFTAHPGSINFTEDIDEVRAKVAHALLQANIAQVVKSLSSSYGLPGERLWATVRATMVGLPDRLPENLRSRAASDLEFLLAPHLPQKALGLMRLHPTGEDIYLPQPNPLHGAGNRVP